MICWECLYIRKLLLLQPGHTHCLVPLTPSSRSHILCISEFHLSSAAMATTPRAVNCEHTQTSHATGTKVHRTRTREDHPTETTAVVKHQRTAGVHKQTPTATNIRQKPNKKTTTERQKPSNKQNPHNSTTSFSKESRENFCPFVQFNLLSRCCRQCTVQLIRLQIALPLRVPLSPPSASGQRLASWIRLPTPSRSAPLLPTFFFFRFPGCCSSLQSRWLGSSMGPSCVSQHQLPSQLPAVPAFVWDVLHTPAVCLNIQFRFLHVRCHSSYCCDPLVWYHPSMIPNLFAL